MLTCFIRYEIDPFKQAEFDLMYDEGVSAIGSILDEAEKLEVTK